MHNRDGTAKIRETRCTIQSKAGMMACNNKLITCCIPTSVITERGYTCLVCMHFVSVIFGIPSLHLSAYYIHVLVSCVQVHAPIASKYRAVADEVEPANFHNDSWPSAMCTQKASSMVQIPYI